MAEGTQFQSVIERKQITAETDRVILCSGNFSYDVQALVQSKSNVALLAVEELLPYPEEKISALLAKSDKSKTKVPLEPRTRSLDTCA